LVRQRALVLTSDPAAVAPPFSRLTQKPRQGIGTVTGLCPPASLIGGGKDGPGETRPSEPSTCLLARGFERGRKEKSGPAVRRVYLFTGTNRPLTAFALGLSTYTDRLHDDISVRVVGLLLLEARVRGAVSAIIWRCRRGAERGGPEHA